MGLKDGGTCEILRQVKLIEWMTSRHHKFIFNIQSHHVINLVTCSVIKIGIRIPVRPDIYRTYNQIRTKFMVFYRYTQIIIWVLSKLSELLKLVLPKMCPNCSDPKISHFYGIKEKWVIWISKNQWNWRNLVKY